MGERMAIIVSDLFAGIILVAGFLFLPLAIYFIVAGLIRAYSYMWEDVVKIYRQISGANKRERIIEKGERLHYRYVMAKHNVRLRPFMEWRGGDR